jgi:uncharacterized protein (DUF433 family)
MRVHPVLAMIVDVLIQTAVVNSMPVNNLSTIVESHPARLSGTLVFCGTRVPVSALFENLKDGASIDQFLEWFPGVTRAQVEALLDHEMSVLAQIA